MLFSYTIKDIYLYLGGVLYYILLTYYTGTTLGKKLMNLRVVAETGEKLTLFNVIYRETIGRFLCSFLGESDISWQELMDRSGDCMI